MAKKLDPEQSSLLTPVGIESEALVNTAPSMPTSNLPSFYEVSQKNLKHVVEKKQNFLYVSWANAIIELRRLYPDSRWTFTKFPDETGREIVPYYKDATGYYVEVTVYLGKEDSVGHTLLMPVTDMSNKAKMNCSSTDISNQGRRALVKCIAEYTGLGLYIYAGEDLPRDYTKEEIKSKVEEILKIGKDKGLTPQNIKDKASTLFNKPNIVVSELPMDSLEELKASL